MSPAPAPVLEVRQVHHSFGDVVALRGVDVEVRAGEVVGLLGPNGAGKTTLVRIIATLLEPDDGGVIVCGRDARRDPAGVRGHLGLAGQFASVDELLTGRENLELIGRLYGIETADCRARADELLVSLGLTGAGNRRVGTYSGGMRRRLDLGATLIGEPSLLLLDEPTTGLDPRSRIEMWDLVDAIAERGTALLVTSQNLEEVERLADRVIVLDDGTVIADDHPQALQRQIGGHIVDVRVDTSLPDAGRADPGALAVTHQALRAGGLDARVDPARGRVTAPTTGALPAAVDVARHLIAEQVEPVEFALRVPSLEEAFLSLTGTVHDVDTSDEEHGAIRGDELPDRTPPVRTRSAARDVAVATGRDWTRLLRTPESLFFAAVQPVLFVLGLAAVFGDLVENVLGQDYIQFLLPGVVVMQVALAAGATGVGLASDLRDGIIDRFRSLPMSQVAVLAGGLAALFLALLFGYAATWLFAAVGLAVKDPQAANFVGFAPVLLFVYLSSAWVPIETMSGAVQGFARHQPVNVTIEAVRGLANGTDATGEIVQSIAWSLALIVAFSLLATRQFRNATS